MPDNRKQREEIMALKFLLTFISTDLICIFVVYLSAYLHDKRSLEFSGIALNISLWLTYIASIFYIWSI
jgi:hypothetical protein